MMQSLSVTLLALIISGCMGVGSHGSIEAYQYAVPKSKLQNVVYSVIIASPNIKQDTLRDYYNNDSVYLTIQISEPGISNNYTIRFYDWKQGVDSTEYSSISIAYAFNKNIKEVAWGMGV
ncbi:MAG: hypothetical protein ABI378_03640 [Chitinophagaceae bacterium]